MAARKAVVPAAGLGTRFLPATKAQPKEMLPLVDVPTIEYVLEEAADAGLADCLVVTSRGKQALEDHFDRAPLLETTLAQDGKEDLLEAIRAPSQAARLHAVRQQQPLGLGHAVACARDHVDGEAFAVLLGDDLVRDKGALLRRMQEIVAETGRSAVAVKPCSDDELSRYGVIAGEPHPREKDRFQVTDLVEKPTPSQAPSSYGVIGRYVLTPDIFDELAATEPGKSGEIQLTDALTAQASREPINAVVCDAVRYDVGDKADFLRATVEFAAARGDVGPEFRRFLRDFVDGMRDD